MYAHIYGRKHAEYLCPFANTLNDKSLWPNRLISYGLRRKKKKRPLKLTHDETVEIFSTLYLFFFFLNFYRDISLVLHDEKFFYFCRLVSYERNSYN